MDPVTQISYQVNQYKLLAELDHFRTDFIMYSDPKHGDVNGWEVLRETEQTIVMKEQRESFLDQFNITCESRARYYILKPDLYLPPHIDFNTTCAVNFILSGGESPVSYESGEYIYDNAVLDTTKLHWVQNSGSPRILFKISIFDMDYEELVWNIQNS